MLDLIYEAHKARGSWWQQEAGDRGQLSPVHDTGVISPILSLVIIIGDKWSDKWWHTRLPLQSVQIADGYWSLFKVAWFEVVHRNVPARRREEGNIFHSLSHSFYIWFWNVVKSRWLIREKMETFSFFRWNCVSWVNWLPFTNEGRDIWLSRLDSPALARQNKTFISSNRSPKHKR